MIDPIAFVLATLALLMTPGPTNTLLAASGAAVGLRRSLALLPAELAAYLLAIGAFLILAAPTVADHPAAETALRLLAAGWLARSAVRLWRSAGGGFADCPFPVDPSRVFCTTLINPKAMIFAFIVFPSTPPTAAFLVFSTLVLSIGFAWIGIGAIVAGVGRSHVTPARVSRFAAVAMALFATLVTGSAIAGG
jgi:threonine/homoserine/homoserine lactone efflux protein